MKSQLKLGTSCSVSAAILNKSITHWDTEKKAPCRVDISPSINDATVSDVTFKEYDSFTLKRPERGHGWRGQKGTKRMIDVADLPTWDDVKHRFLDIKHDPQAVKLVEEWEAKNMMLYKHKKMATPITSNPPSTDPVVKKLEALGYHFTVKVEEDNDGWIPKDDSIPLGRIINSGGSDTVKGKSVFMHVQCFYRDGKKSIAGATLQGYPTVYGKKVSTHKVYTDAKHRNQGIASALFKYVEDVTGYKVEASSVKTPHGQALWHKYSQTSGYYCLHDMTIGSTIQVQSSSKTVKIKSIF